MDLLTQDDIIQICSQLMDGNYNDCNYYGCNNEKIFEKDMKAFSITCKKYLFLNDMTYIMKKNIFSTHNSIYFKIFNNHTDFLIKIDNNEIIGYGEKYSFDGCTIYGMIYVKNTCIFDFVSAKKCYLCLASFLSAKTLIFVGKKKA